MPAAFLTALESNGCARVAEHFDLIAGTSTGAIIAIALGLGMSAAEILNFYRSEGPKIFSQEAIFDSPLADTLARISSRIGRKLRRIIIEKYDARRLAASLSGAFGSKVLGDSKVRLVIPAFDPRLREVHIFKTRHHSRFTMDWKTRASDVALSSSAAPTYLPSHILENGISLIDGGVWANNPTGIAVVEAVTVLGWEKSDIYVLSLGCSEELFELPRVAGLAGVGLAMADLFMLGQSRSALGTASLLTDEITQGKRIFRYDHVVPRGLYELDSAKRMKELEGIGVAVARRAMPQIAGVFFSNPAERFEAIP